MKFGNAEEREKWRDWAMGVLVVLGNSEYCSLEIIQADEAMVVRKCAFII